MTWQPLLGSPKPAKGRLTGVKGKADNSTVIVGTSLSTVHKQQDTKVSTGRIANGATVMEDSIAGPQKLNM